MIVDLEQIKQIKQGRKTAHTLPVTDADWTRGAGNRPRCLYRVGRAYTLKASQAAQGAGRITVTNIRLATLADVTLQDARAEGFRTRQDFRDWWAEHHGTFQDADNVFVVSFTVGDSTDRPRLLARTPQAPGGDYTHIAARAISDAGEAVTEAEQAGITHEANLRDDIRRRNRLAQLSTADRIADLERRASMGEELARRALFVINQRLEGAEKRLNDRKGAA